MKHPFVSLSHRLTCQNKALSPQAQLNWRLQGALSFRGARRANPKKTDLAFEMLVRNDLDSETGQSLVVVHRRRQVSDRGDAEVTQDLRADADLAPLPVAIGLRRFGFADGLDRNAGSAVAQIDQHAAIGSLEVLQHRLHPRRTGGKEVLDDVGLVQPRQDVLAVADTVIDERGMG